MSAALELSDVTVHLGTCAVVRDVDLDVPRGRWVSLVGPNGAGKTTLLRTITGAAEHTGTVRWDGTDLGRVRGARRARTVAAVPQRPERPAGMSVAAYVLLGRSAHVPYLAVESRRDRRVVDELLATLDLTVFADRDVTSLSGGEFQRVALARALAQQAPVLLLDEPTSALDLGYAQEVLELVDRLRLERGLTVVSALHDLTLAAQFSEELTLLVGGQVVERGAPDRVLTAATIAEHYRADVHVLRGPDGGPVPVPYRRGACG